MIRAESHSDDHVYEVDFDAESWFKAASELEIVNLAKCSFGGDLAADAVAQDSRGKVEGLNNMFDYIHLHNKGKKHIGFECYVNEDDAKAWLKANKPTLYVTLFLLELPCGYRLDDADDDAPACSSRDMCSSSRCSAEGCVRLADFVKAILAEKAAKA